MLGKLILQDDFSKHCTCTCNSEIFAVRKSFYFDGFPKIKKTINFPHLLITNPLLSDFCKDAAFTKILYSKISITYY